LSALLLALLLSQASSSPRCALIESVEGQVCYLRCSGDQTLYGNLRVTGVLTAGAVDAGSIASSSVQAPYIQANYVDAGLVQLGGRFVSRVDSAQVCLGSINAAGTCTGGAQVQWNPNSAIFKNVTGGGSLTILGTASAFNGSVSTTGDEFRLSNATTQAFYCSHATGQCFLVSNMNDATVSPTVPAMALKALVNVTDGDLLIGVQNSTGANVFTVDEQGISAASGRLTSRSAIGGFSFGSAGTEYFGMAAGSAISAVGTTGKLELRAGDGTPGTGTGIAALATSEVRHHVHKLRVTNAALTAAGTTDITVWTLASDRVLRMTATVSTTFTGGALTDVDVTCGTSAGGAEYLVSFDVDTATGFYGDQAAEIGASLTAATVADFPAAAVQCRFTCAGANCSEATQGTMDLHLETVTYP
jgi:hypothetical protein